MTRWTEFEESAPDLAALGRSRLENDELMLLGSIKADGSPRISPVEPDIVDGDLMLGMIWQSRKATDLLRDPRCTVVTLVTDRKATEGEFKIVGNAIPVEDEDRREAYCRTLLARIGWRPDGEFHLVAIDIERVWRIEFAHEKMNTRRWPPVTGQGLR